MDLSGVDLWTIPFAPPPPGEVVNFVDPPSQAPMLATGIYVFVPLMLVFFFCRLYTRIHMTHAFGLDDFLCIVAVVAILATSGVMLASLKLEPISPSGRHAWNLITLTYVMSLMAAMFVKLSILALYYRIFQPSPWARILIWAGMAPIALFYLISAVVILSLCVPGPSETWLFKVSTGACPAVQVKLGLGVGIFGIVSDLYIFVIPLWQISHLSLAPKRLLSPSAIGSSAGGFATREQVTLDDPTYLLTPYLFSLAELNFGLMCSCMPVITVSLKAWANKTVSSWHSVKKYYYSNTFGGQSRSEANNTGGGIRGDRYLKEELPRIPGGAMSGMRTFIRRFNRSTNAQSVPMSNFVTLNSMSDKDYHGQLRDIYGADHDDAERLAPCIAGQSRRGMNAS
ncbi:hypothetical protein B0H63DRAFT_512909 [Podospora didyma]|uniref:Rhodopsin domain-containing protein n=1 Tax=Podospora didyma TaxID=330526 RepID=A0AAE0KDZ4_9PEZI|nr:hypothetical protein B0H63DRAFT_512909 [Podospora didyma]